MESCDWCSLSEKDKQFQVYEGRLWSVFLSDEQDYIGRCILVLKRHCNSLSEMTDDEREVIGNKGKQYVENTLPWNKLAADFLKPFMS